MTWLHGETTWGAVLDKVIDLATGASADDFGVTTDLGSRWRRPLAGVSWMAAPATTDVALVQEHRAG